MPLELLKKPKAAFAGRILKGGFFAHSRGVEKGVPRLSLEM